MTSLSRRRFLSISAASVAVPSGAFAAPQAHWQGSALGAPASMRFAGLTQDEAAPVIAAVEAEVRRLELIFSLYRPESEISRLNADGRLLRPSAELLDVLALSRSLFLASEGAFDPTIQPLWAAVAARADAATLAEARRRVGFEKLQFDTDAVHFGSSVPGALTLNGIAQGAVSDRIAGLLADMGLRNVLVDCGEVVALGGRSAAEAWKVGVQSPDGQLMHRVRLSDRALATSAPSSLVLDTSSGLQHILQPDGGAAARQLVSISSRSAALADGLSTAACLVPVQMAEAMVAGFPDCRIEKQI